MKKVFLLLLLSCCLLADAQPPPKPPIRETVVAFIKGHPYETKIERDFFRNDFDLVLSDTTYTIEKFLASWDDVHGNLHALPVSGARMPANTPDHLLSELGNNIFFEQIIIRKADDLFRILALSITLSDAATAQKAREELALCSVFIAGHPSTNSLYSSAFSSDVNLQLTDSSYHIVDFELVLEDEKEREEVFTKLKGSLVPVEKDEVTRLLKKLRPGNTVIFENIRVEKNGKFYKIPTFYIYIK